MSESYFDLASRLEAAFPEIENDALTDLTENNKDYTDLQEQLSALKCQHPFIEQLVGDGTAMDLTAEQCAALGQFIAIYSKLEEMERIHLYFRGHTDAFAYLKKINAI